MTLTSPVWFITGCSTGLGRELAKAVLARGDRAIVTARDASSIASLVEGHDGRAIAVALDVTRPRDIGHAVSVALTAFGTIDVLVNNAGYGYQSSVEEGEDAEIRAQFEANVYGLYAMTRAVLPTMRKNRRGHIVNVTSVAGLIGFPASGYYSASKHAVEGWSDSLLSEVGPLGIHVTCVEPGPFRTDWAGRSLRQTPNNISDYAETAGARLKTTSGKSGTQEGDPARAALAMMQAVDAEAPPRHLVLGAFGLDAVTKRLQARLDEIEAWRAVGEATSFVS